MRYNMLTKQIFLYIAVAIVSFIAVTTICYKHDYNKVYNYYSDALYQQATEYPANTELTFLSLTACRL